MPDCACPLAGFCERHGIEKTEQFRELCRTNPKYFQAWEEGRGPRQTGAEKTAAVSLARSRRPKPEGPGTELRRLIADRGYKIHGGCGCKSKIRKMDSWGVAGCRDRLDEITGWLVDAAKQAGWLNRLAVSTPGASTLARREIRKMVVEAIDAAANL